VFSQDNKYEVFALKFATNGKFAISDIAVGAVTKDSVEVCYMFWLLKGKNGRTVLVDAGFSDTTKMPNLKYIRPDLMLEKINIRPNQITDIIVTHPHWDHIDGVDLFPEAMVWMQKDDFDYFVGTAWQKGGSTIGFKKKDVQKVIQKNLDQKLTLVKGDDLEIIPGIKVFIGSRHTYESQYVLVNSTSEKVIIASDASWYYYNLVNLLPIPLTFDSKGYLENLKRMKTMVKDVDLIIPGHDPLVFSKFPKVAVDVVRIRD
jgi:glyoxylase-like metal-dependent hydrolase (beta-lactamase superfamily II)